MQYAPIVVFAYKRYDHTVATLTALNNAELANETELFIFCDANKNENDKEDVEKVRNYIFDFSQKALFRKVVVEKAEKNKGLAVSIIEGVTRIIEKYKRVIVVEDDLVVSKYFIRYMNAALDYYYDSENVWAISGYSFPMSALKEYPHDVYYSGRGCSWGWATWENRWNLVDWKVEDYASFNHNWLKRYRFSKWGADMPLMLDRQMRSEHNSWAIRWCYQAYKEGMFTIYPKESFLKNIGIDGSGTHSTMVTNKFDTNLYSRNTYDITFENLSIDKKIQKEFGRKYSNGWLIDLKAQIKGLLIRLGIIRI